MKFGITILWVPNGFGQIFRNLRYRKRQKYPLATGDFTVEDFSFWIFLAQRFNTVT
jgi:hypothetical protein